MNDWPSPLALICDQCGYEVKIDASENYSVTAPIDKTDMQVDWSSQEMIHSKELSAEPTCGCRVCPYTYDPITEKVGRREEPADAMGDS